MNETKLNQLVINKLSKEQYNAAKESGQLSENEIYITPYENDIPNPEDLQNGNSIVSVDGKWEEQNGYAYTKYVTEISRNNMMMGGGKLYLSEVEITDATTSISCHLKIVGVRTNVDEDVTFTKVSFLSNHKIFEYKYGSTITTEDVFYITIEDGKLFIESQGFLGSMDTYNLQLTDFNCKLYQINKFNSSYIPSSLDDDSLKGYGKWGILGFTKFIADEKVSDTSYTWTLTSMYIDMLTDLHDELSIDLSYYPYMEQTVKLNRTSGASISGNSKWEGTWNEASVTLTQNMMNYTLSISNLSQNTFYYFRSSGFNILGYTQFDDALIPKEFPNPSELPDGSSMVTSNGKWEAQNNYAHIKHFTEVDKQGISVNYEYLIGNAKITSGYPSMTISAKNGSNTIVEGYLSFTQTSSNLFEASLSSGSNTSITFKIYTDTNLLYVKLSTTSYSYWSFNLSIKYINGIDIYEVVPFGIEYLPKDTYMSDGMALVWHDNKWNLENRYPYSGKIITSFYNIRLELDSSTNNYVWVMPGRITNVQTELQKISIREQLLETELTKNSDGNYVGTSREHPSITFTLYFDQMLYEWHFRMESPEYISSMRLAIYEIHGFDVVGFQTIDQAYIENAIPSYGETGDILTLASSGPIWKTLLPDASNVPDGTTIIAKNGKWVEQNGYGYDSYFDSISLPMTQIPDQTSQLEFSYPANNDEHIIVDTSLDSLSMMWSDKKITLTKTNDNIYTGSNAPSIDDVFGVSISPDENGVYRLYGTYTWITSPKYSIEFSSFNGFKLYKTFKIDDKFIKNPLPNASPADAGKVLMVDSNGQYVLSELPS